ncbi:uncharacterized protein METZ01_LOCUS506844 [marine metagenome]|uniref:Uncharacterized protein n=1 Tax=marine metagenome TaxID=408172 RepID=A0A383EC80_9ZZZZ
MYFKQKIYYPFRLAELYALIIHTIIVTIVMINLFEIKVILLIIFINFLIYHAVYHIGFMIQSSPRTKILLDLYNYQKIDKDKYTKIYTIDVILDNRLKRFTSSNQIQIENKTVKLMNKGKLLKLVYNIFVVFKYLF